MERLAQPISAMFQQMELLPCWPVVALHELPVDEKKVFYLVRNNEMKRAALAEANQSGWIYKTLMFFLPLKLPRSSSRCVEVREPPNQSGQREVMMAWKEETSIFRRPPCDPEGLSCSWHGQSKAFWVVINQSASDRLAESHRSGAVVLLWR